MAAVLQYPLAKVCQVTAKLLFESCFVGYFPSVVRMRTICNRTLDLLGFCHEGGLPSHLICVVRNSVADEAHPIRWNTIPTVGRIPAVAAYRRTNGCPEGRGPVGTSLRF